MTCLFRFQGLGLAANVVASPGQMGHGDIGSTVGASVTGVNTAVARLDFSSFSIPTRAVRVLRGFDSALGTDVFYMTVLPTATPWISPGVYSGPWSCRMYVRVPANIAAMTFIQFRKAGTANLGFARLYSADRIARTGSGSGVTLPAPAAMYRIEIQADPARTSNLVWRVYREDSVTPISGFQENITDVGWDEVRIGSLTSGNFATDQFDFADIEIHDDYDLGGRFRSSPQDGTTPASATAEGVPSFNPSYEERFRVAAGSTVARGTPTFTTYANVSYTTAGTFGRNLDLYVPNGTPPAGGWPVVSWGHSGFFSDGLRTDLPTAWRNDLLLRGYAVATIQYVRTSKNVAGSYDPYGVGSLGGRYPSFILDYKRAAAFLRDNASTYSINASKMFATGYSAGGYIALAAAMTRGLATDSAGTKMTLAGAAADSLPWADGYTGADPQFIGAYVYAAPVNMDLARAWDPTHPNQLSLTRLLAYRWFQGLIANGSDSPTYPRQSIASHIGLNTAGNLCAVGYCRGSADGLIPAEHEAALSSALAAKGVAYTAHVTPNNHDDANRIYSTDQIINWMDSIANPGGSPLRPQLQDESGVPLGLADEAAAPLALD